MARDRQRHERHGRRPRRHHHPLLRLLGADHADGVPRDQGRRGRRVRLRRRRDGLAVRRRAAPTPGPTPATRCFAEAEARTRGPAEHGSGGAAWHDPREDGVVPDAYIAMGQTAENVATLRGLTRRELDEFGVRSQNLAEKALADGFWQREITPGHHARRHRRVRRRRPARRASPSRRSSQLKPVFRPDGVVTAGNCCPLNDGAAAVVVMSRHQGRRARDHPAGPDRRHRGQRASPRRSWGSARSRRPGGPSPTPA